MPTYDYVCSKCGDRTEVFQSITASPLKKCPACGKMSLKRLIGTGAAVLFKGEGFYQTDYRSESYKKATKAEATSTGKSTSEKPADPAKSDKPAKPAAAAAAD